MKQNRTSLFNKVVSPGTSQLWKGQFARLYLRIQYTQDNDKDKKRRLSITGVEGPTRDGNCKGSAGQCIDALDRLVDLDVGWTKEIVFRLKQIWKEWHLNDMRAGCVHQRKDWDMSEPLVVTTYTQVGTRFHDLKVLVLNYHATPEEIELFNLSESVYRKLNMGTSDPYPEEDVNRAVRENVLAPWKQVDTIAGWVSPSQHPKGLLTKPCYVCGYKYGTDWLHEDVPNDVIEFLGSLPDCPDGVWPAWV